MFEGVLAGWRDQQLSRNLAADTITARVDLIRRFQRFTNDWPWNWQGRDLEEFTAHVRGGDRGLAIATVRGYHSHIRLFCEYVSDPRYQWTAS
jgi:hypothetical protein